MRMSSGSRRAARLAIVLSTTAAGTINQTTRGFCNFLTNSSSEDDPTAFSPISSLTALGDLSKTTHSFPPLIRRRTILAPILPRPIIPNCIDISFCCPYQCLCLIDPTLPPRGNREGEFLRCVGPSGTPLPAFENVDKLLVASRDLGDGSLPGELTGTPIDHRLPEGSASDCEANESGNRRCNFQPLGDSLVICTPAQNDAANLVPSAASGSGHNLLAVFAAVEPFDLPHVRLDTGLLQLFDGPNH